MYDYSIGFGGDCLEPVWADADRIHDWRNYVNEELQRLWPTFNPEQKRAIAMNAEDIASREHWD